MQSALMPSHISCRCISLERVVHVSGCISYLYLVVSGISVVYRYLVVSRFLVVPRCISRVRALLGQRLLISPLIMGISQAQHHGRGSCVAHFPDP